MSPETARAGGLASLGPRLRSIAGTTWARVRSDPEIARGLALGLLTLVALSWIPFYPAWVLVLLAVGLGGIGTRAPYLATVLVGVLAVFPAGHQNGVFGFAMLGFALLVGVAAFFDWRFGFLIWLTVSLAPYGLAPAVPLVAAFLFPGLLVLSSSVFAAAFLVFLAVSGTPLAFGFFVSPPHDYSFVLFANPAPSPFVPGAMVAAFEAIRTADATVLVEVAVGNVGLSVVPVLQAVTWVLATLFALQYAGSPSRRWRLGWGLAAAVALLVGFFGAWGAAGYAFTAPVLLVGLGLVPVVLVAFTVGPEMREAFAPLLRGRASVGTRLGGLAARADTRTVKVGGLEDVKEDLRDALQVPLLHAERARRYGVEPTRGLLLFGPPGCGKTSLMRALASELNVEMLAIKCSDLMSKWYGESEERMVSLFREARERVPCILFFDDVDAITKSRDLYAGDDVTPRLLSLLLSELDGLDRTSGVVVVASTNRPELIDPAFLRPGRLDKSLYVPSPDLREREAILAVHAEGLPLSPKVDLGAIAKRTEHFSGADLAYLVREASTRALKRSLAGEEGDVITMADFAASLERAHPSITPAMREAYEKLRIRFERKAHEIERTEERDLVGLRLVGQTAALVRRLDEGMGVLVRNPDLVRDLGMEPSPSALLVGPQGCGKGTVAEGLAEALDVDLRTLEGAAVLAADRPGLAILEAFELAKEAAPCVLQIRNVEQLAQNDLLSTLLSALSALHAEDRVLVVGTTTRPDRLPPELLRPAAFGRVELVPPPGPRSRRALLALHLDPERVEGLDEAFLERLVKRTKAWTARDLLLLITNAKLAALQAVRTGKGWEAEPALRREHLEAALAGARSSMSADERDAYRAFAATVRGETR